MEERGCAHGLIWGENEKALPPAEVCGSSWWGGTLQWEQTQDGHLAETHLHLGKNLSLGSARANACVGCPGSSDRVAQKWFLE